MLAMLGGMSARAADSFPFTVENVGDYQRRKGNTLTLYQYNGRHKPEIVLPANFGGVDCWVEGRRCFPGARIPIDLAKSRRGGAKWEVRFRASGQARRYFVRPLPGDFPEYSTSGESKLAKAIVMGGPVSGRGNSHLLIVGPKGDLLFYRQEPVPVFDFRPHSAGGKNFFSYLELTGNNAQVNSEGLRVVLDDGMNPIKRFGPCLDMHEFYYFGGDHFMASYFELRQSPLGIAFIDQRIKEYDGEKLLFDFGFDDLRKSGVFLPAIGAKRVVFQGRLATNAFHLNAFTPFPDGRLLVSYGGDTVIFLRKDTKEIEWSFAGANDQYDVAQAIAPWFFHSPIFDPARRTLTLFDNGNPEIGSRVLEYTLDMAKKKVEKFDVIRAQGEFTDSMGSVMVDGDVYSIDFAELRKGKSTFVEMADHKTTMEIAFKARTFSPYRIYRADF